MHPGLLVYAAPRLSTIPSSPTLRPNPCHVHWPQEEREKAKPQGTKITGMRFRTEARKLERLAAVEAWNLAKQEPTQ